MLLHTLYHNALCGSMIYIQHTIKEDSNSKHSLHRVLAENEVYFYLNTPLSFSNSSDFMTGRTAWVWK